MADSLDIEQDFLNYDGITNKFIIYQFKDPSLIEYRCSMNFIKDQGLEIKKEYYKAVYSNNLAYIGIIPTMELLEKIFFEFNCRHHDDFNGYLLSIGDVIGINESGDISYYYCDAIGFYKLPKF